MSDHELEALRDAYAAIGARHAPEQRPSIAVLERRIDRRRRHRATVLTTGGVIAVLLVAVVALLPRHTERTSHVLTGPGSRTTRPSPAAFCSVAESIQRENAAPLRSVPTREQQQTSERSQLLRLVAVAAPDLAAALEREIAALDAALHRQPASASSKTLLQGAAMLRDTLRYECGLSLSIFLRGVAKTTSTSAPGPPVTPAACTRSHLVVAAGYVGRTPAQAYELAVSRGETVRIVSVDGQGLAVTTDLNGGRVDLYVVAGRVAAACHE